MSFIIAFCAVLISAASFYATYLQADAAEKQVKAMTLPIVHFSSSNYDPDSKQQRLYLELKNVGIGPAIVRYQAFTYKEQRFFNPIAVMKACCEPELTTFLQAQKGDPNAVGMVTNAVQNVMVQGQDSYEYLSLEYDPSSAPLWQAFNTARFQMQVDICFCSLLDDCYQSQQRGQMKPVDACPIPPEESLQSY